MQIFYVDKTIDRTDYIIVGAFNELVMKKDFEKITVKDIYELAGISKATFYRHFHDKYDVMNYNYKMLLDYSGNLDSVHSFEDLYFQLFSGAQDYWGPIKRTFKSTGYNSFRHFIATYSYDYAENIVKLNRDGKGFTETEKLQCVVYVYGIAEMYERWTYGQINLSAKEAAKALFDMMPETVKYYWK
ncbi:MAG: TetR/AcrR family transcriptional regulator [Oscillospiraceae bacterium]|nr:TetR/AcrR family transcriptional regulator [Oscillospiraceae bacterium]